jgi:hypothetical protein
MERVGRLRRCVATIMGTVRVAERFAIPYSFAPNLSLAEACASLAFALARIFLGSLLFAFWGVGTALLYHAIGSQFWRIAVLPPALLVFLLGMAGLMAAISALARGFLRQ